jgi:hypothetical protein
MDLTPFIIESVLATFVALILEAFSLRQVVYDIVERERLRYLTVSHYLTQVACVLFVIMCVDSQCGLGFYSQSTLLCFGNMKGFFLIASARAMAAGFVESYKLITKGPEGPQTGKVLLIEHAIFVSCAVVLCLVLLGTRNPWLALVVRCTASLYSIVVGIQVIVSTLKVRSILVEENKRAAKYADGIKKLNRFLILVFIVLLAGNISIFLGLDAAVNLARTQSHISEEVGPFQSMHIVNDVTTSLTHAALLLGAWSINRKDVAYTSNSRKTTVLSTELSRRLDRANTHTGSGLQGGSTCSTNAIETTNIEEGVIEAQSP